MGRAVRLTLIIFFAVMLTVALCAVSVSNVAAGVAAADNGDKIPVNVSVQGSNVFTYRGAAVYRQSSFDRPLDLPADISLRLNTVYTDVATGVSSTDNPVNVGVYKIDYTISEIDANGQLVAGRNDSDGVSLNYTAVKFNDDRVEHEFQIVIQPATLTVYTQNAVMPEGGTPPDLTYTIEGFYGSDNAENSLNTLPTVELPDSLTVGVHEIIASGGSADNYIFNYVAANLTVNSTSATATMPGSVISITVSGEFSPNTQYAMSELSADAPETEALIDHIRNYRVANWTANLEAVYHFEVVSGGSATSKDTPLKVSVSGLTLPTDLDYFIVQVDSYGVVTKITNYNYMNGVLSFDTYSADGAIMIYSAHQNEITIAIVIAAVVLILILLLIAARVKYINEKKDISDRKKKKAPRMKW